MAGDTSPVLKNEVSLNKLFAFKMRHKRLNPICIDLFGALWYWGGGCTMCPQILKPLLKLKFLSKSNKIKAER